MTVTADGVADTLNDSSSRGVHGSYGISKPDVAAPGTTISSVAVGTADGSSVKSGTSMAAPHAAGIAAITAEAHPDFTPVQVKAAVMNTASHDVRIGEAIFGPQRVGSGRVDAAGAVATDVIAYDTENPDGVSVTFGVLEVSEATTLTRSVTIENHGDASATLGASYTPQTEVPGVAYSVSPANVTVAAGGSATVDVTLTISDPAALAKTLDPVDVGRSGSGPRA
ncbi:S8 family serine peptidase [Salana multivorans]